MSRARHEHPHHAHRAAAPEAVPTAVLTVSDTRTLETDAAGALIAEMLGEAGQPVSARELVRDEPTEIADRVRALVAREDTCAVIVTGGTGVSPRDRTPEAVEPLLERVLPGFGEIFRALSYEEIGAAAMVSRALAGVAGGCPVFVLPGSRGAVRLAMSKLVLPELGHLVGEARKGAD